VVDSTVLDNMRQVRVGTSLGFTVYAQFGERPTKSDPYLGVFNNAQLAAYAIEAVNNRRVEVDMPWVAIGRLIYPGPGVDRLDDFIAVMATVNIARWLANTVADLAPEGAHD
jgi:hypothetical protein